jgi:hypothetical protein
MVRHSRESGNPERQMLLRLPWTPAFAGVTAIFKAWPQIRSSKQPPTRSLLIRKRACAAGSLRSLPRRGLLARSRRYCRNPVRVIWPSSVMAGPALYYTITSRGCRSIAAMVSRRQMAETGSPSTVPAGSFWITAGGQLTHQRENRRKPARPDASPDGFGVLAPPPHDHGLNERRSNVAA